MDSANVFITDLVGNPGTPKARLNCSCGVEITTLLADAVPQAVRHIKDVHRHGRFHYKDITRKICLDGRSWPVLGEARVMAFNRKHIA